MKKFILILPLFISLLLSCEVLSGVYDEELGSSELDYYSANIGTLKYVPAGAFLRDAGNGGLNKSMVSAFRMGQNEITQAQYVAVTGASNPTYFIVANGFTVDTSRPVDRVTWFDAVEFCNKLSQREGLTPVYSIIGRTPATGYPITAATVTATWTNNGYRLPTEMEWMWAAMGATKDNRSGDIVGGVNIGGHTKGYSGSNESAGTQVNVGNYAWYDINTTPDSSFPVGTKQPNELGLYDISGNLWEWCWDQWDSLAPYPGGLLTDYKSEIGASRVVRGGSWSHDAPSNIPIAIRGSLSMNVPDRRFGFRVVRL